MLDTRLLLVTDDPNTGQLWAYGLAQKGIKVMVAGSAKESRAFRAKDTFDLIVIDMYTPKLDGVQLCRELRLEFVNPILLITYAGSEPALLEAYQAGADECIVKPLSPALFLAKVMAWLRRSWTMPVEALDSVQAGKFRLDSARRQLVKDEKTAIKLTNLEFRLLYLLMSHPGQVLNTDMIVNQVWGYAGSGDSALLKNVVYRLRRKTEPDPSQPTYLQTIAGEGYTFQPM